MKRSHQFRGRINQSLKQNKMNSKIFTPMFLDLYCFGYTNDTGEIWKGCIKEKRTKSIYISPPLPLHKSRIWRRRWTFEHCYYLWLTFSKHAAHINVKNEKYGHRIERALSPYSYPWFKYCLFISFIQVGLWHVWLWHQYISETWWTWSFINVMTCDPGSDTWHWLHVEWFVLAIVRDTFMQIKLIHNQDTIMKYNPKLSILREEWHNANSA